MLLQTGQCARTTVWILTICLLCFVLFILHNHNHNNRRVINVFKSIFHTHYSHLYHNKQVVKEMYISRDLTHKKRWHVTRCPSTLYHSFNHSIFETLLLREGSRCLTNFPSYFTQTHGKLETAKYILAKKTTKFNPWLWCFIEIPTHQLIRMCMRVHLHNYAYVYEYNYLIFVTMLLVFSGTALAGFAPRWDQPKPLMVLELAWLRAAQGVTIARIAKQHNKWAKTSVRLQKQKCVLLAPEFSAFMGCLGFHQEFFWFKEKQQSFWMKL